MDSSISGDPMMQDTDFLREIAGAREWIIENLSTAGTDDIGADELVVFAAIAGGASIQVIADLGQDLVIPEHALGRVVDSLKARGYFELRKNPLAPRRPMISATKQGSDVYHKIVHATHLKRYADFAFRPDDIIIATLPKSGTTWMQMICALLVLQTPALPAPLQELSPQIDSHEVKRDPVYKLLDGQQHRRFIKTHLELDYIQSDPRLTYIVVARHPLDCAISLYNVIKAKDDIELADSGTGEQPAHQPIPAAHDALLGFIDADPGADTGEQLTLPSMLRHLSSAWARRDEPNMVLLHYEDLLADLDGEMRGLAGRLGIAVPEAAWPELVRAATFEQMRAAADRLQPVPVFKDQPERFFRSGRAGTGRELLSEAEQAHYDECAGRLAPPDLLAWLHR
jgi:aryl sulfotransferase